MRKYIVIFSSILIVASLLSLSYAQTEQKGRMIQERMGGQMAPPESGFAAMSPDSKFVYVVGKDTLYQYTAKDLKLKKSAYIGSADVKRLIGGSIFFSNDSKLLYIMRGKTLLLFEALELNFINKVTIE